MNVCVWEYTYTYIPTHVPTYVYIIVPYCVSLKNYVRHTLGCNNKRRCKMGRKTRKASPQNNALKNPISMHIILFAGLVT